jgi:O-acetyl-ADP-ribose deacetylase (regulator of RNase III)
VGGDRRDRLSTPVQILSSHDVYTLTMSKAIAIHLRDLGAELVDAWRREFDGIASVTVSLGDIFSRKPGPIGPGDPIDVKADAVISPANSFGFMDGGIDALYTYQFGAGVQERLQDSIVREHGGELPVGEAVIVRTDHPDIPWCISAPTMRIPRDVSDTVNAYLAFRAALRAVLDHNRRGGPLIESILCPGLATSVGRMPVHRCARQMRVAWDRVLGGSPTFPSSLRDAGADEMDLLR